MPVQNEYMANTSSRTLRLLSLLQTHRFWPGSELAERLEVSPRTVRRDVDRLRELGYPVNAQPGVDGGYQLASGAALPPLVIDDEEAVALAVSLRVATLDASDSTDSSDGAGVMAEAAARALAKVSQVMPARLRRRADAVAAMTDSATWDRPGLAAAVNPDVLSAIALACRDTERIRFGYTAANGESTRRHVEPLRLVALDRRWYLVAYDVERGDWRNFRVDRVADVPVATGARFRPRSLPAEDAAEYVRRSISSTGRTEVTVLVEAPAEVVRERIGRWATVTEQGPARCLATMRPPGNLDWAVIAMGVTGADFRVIDPPELAARVADWAARFARAVRDDSATDVIA